MSRPDPSEVWREIRSDESLRFGELALALGKIAPDQLERALAAQAGESSPRRLAHILEDQGALTAPQTAEILLELERHAGKPLLPRIDRFLILHELGRGGMGVVSKAWDPKLHRTVALKVLRVDQELERACFLREARLAGRLSHPNIPAIHEILDHQGSPCIAMALVRGTRLDVAAPDLPLRRIVEILRDAARAVHYAHTQQVIHRDLKPENLMLDSDGKVFVMDFGLAKAAHPGSSISTADAVVGTPAYMPPEQALGRRADVGPRSDVYGLGATLYALAAGRPPFDGASAAEVLMRVAHDDPPPLRKFRPKIPREIETIVHRALEKTPRRRYASAAKLADDLDRYLQGEPILARPSGRIARAVKSLRKRWVAVGSAAVALLAIGLAAIVLAQKGAAARRRAKAQPKFDLAQAAFERAERMVFQPDADVGRQLEEFQKAKALFDETLGIDPAFAEAYLYRARTSRYLGDPRAYDDFDAAIRLHPTLRKAYLARGLARIEDASRRNMYPVLVGHGSAPADSSSRTAEGRGDVERALTLAESEEDRLFAEAMVARASGQDAAAVDLLNRYLEIAKTDAAAYAWRGICRFARSSYVEALADYDRSLSLRPNHLDTRLKRAMLRSFVGDSHGAAEDVRRVPNTVYGMYAKAHVLTESGDAASALPLAQDLVSAEPTDPMWHITLARTFNGLGRGEEALLELEAALRLGAPAPLVHLNRSETLRKLGRTDEALAAADEALAAGATPFAARLERAFALERCGRVGDALAEYRACLELEPGSQPAAMNCGGILSDQGRYSEAVAVLREAVARNSRCAGLEVDWGNCEHRQGRTIDAIPHYDRALELNPDLDLARKNRGIALTALGRPAEARRDFDETLRRDPKNAEALYGRGKLSEIERKWEEAAADFGSASTCDPQYEAAFYAAGLAWVQAGRNEKALEAFEDGLGRHPQVARLHGGRGLALIQMNRPAEAEPALRRSLELKDDAAVRCNLALVLCRLDRGEEAVSEYRTVVHAAPSLWPAAANLARLLLQQGKYDEAAAVCRDAGRNDPKNSAEYEELLRRAERRRP